MSVHLKTILLLVVCICASPFFLPAQHAYDASWNAGLLGIGQNPASILTSPHKRSFALGALDLSAQNNLFQTNDIRRSHPVLLLGNMFQSPGELAFTSKVRDTAFSALVRPTYIGDTRSHIQYPAYYFRLKDNPDLVERGLIQRVVGIRLERRELMHINALDARIADAYVNRFQQLEGQTLQQDYLEIKVREWDALAGNFGVSLGKGKNLLHLVVGAKLLSSASFLDMKAYGVNLSFQQNEEVLLSGDSIVMAYNPSLARASVPGGKRRYDYFEASFGFAGEFGIVYQINNINRKPIYEFGASIQDLGVIQYWNLRNERHELGDAMTSLSELAQVEQGVDATRVILQNLSTNSVEKGKGITENLPLRITTHAKMRLGKKGWALQVRGDFRHAAEQADWQSFFRATLSYEGQKFAVFFSLFIFLRLSPRIGKYSKCHPGISDCLRRQIYPGVQRYIDKCV